jgi:hypothetical protein
MTWWAFMGCKGGEATWADSRLLAGRGRMVRLAELGQKEDGPPEADGQGKQKKIEKELASHWVERGFGLEIKY